MVIGTWSPKIGDPTREMLKDMGRLVKFFESVRELTRMAPHDELARGGTQYVLADPGRSYIAYASGPSGNIGLKRMAAGTYEFTWLDCASGKTVKRTGVRVPAGDASWPRPPGIGSELAVAITRPGAAGRRRAARSRHGRR